jgi:molybdopterin-synthase adenylyltransferase
MDNISQLTEKDLNRYQRQIVIPYLGRSGQEKLKNAHVCIIGVGGLGCTSANYLSAAGIGHITLVDFDIIELSDLNRQILYWEEDIGKKKVSVASDKLSRLNPDITITAVDSQITSSNADSIIQLADIVIDGLDNMESRLILNKACIDLKKTFIYGGVSYLSGMATTIIPGSTPCLSCISSEGLVGKGVLAMSPAIIANIQAIEAIKTIIGLKPSLAGKLLTFNGEEMKFRLLDIARNENCNICGRT